MTAVLRFASVVALALAAASVPGCHSAPVKYETPAPGTYDASVSRQVTIRGCGIQLFGVIPIRTNTRQVRAYAALDRILPGSVFTDIKQQERWSFIVIGQRFCTTLTATAHPDTREPEQREPKPDPWGRHR